VLVCRARLQEWDGVVGFGSACCRLGGFHRRSLTRTRRYPSDMTDAAWRVIDPLLPDPASLLGRGHPEEWCRRDMWTRSSTWSITATNGGVRFPRSVEASAIRSACVRDAEEVRPGVP
jgi:hypothetical protein